MRFIQIDEMGMKELRAHRSRVGNEELVGWVASDRKLKVIYEGLLEIWAKAFLRVHTEMQLLLI